MQRVFFQGTLFLTSYGSGDNVGAAFVVRDTTLSTGRYRIARIPGLLFGFCCSSIPLSDQHLSLDHFDCSGVQMISVMRRSPRPECPSVSHLSDSHSSQSASWPIRRILAPLNGLPVPFVRRTRHATLRAVVVLAMLAVGAALTIPQAWATAAPTTTSLTVTSAGSDVTSVAAGTVVTLTATVNSGATPVQPGQVKFCVATAK